MRSSRLVAYIGALGAVALIGVAYVALVEVPGLGRCDDRRGQLGKWRLEPAGDSVVGPGAVHFQALPGSLIRREARAVSVFRPAAVFCDSGDWGLNAGNQVRLELYDLDISDSQILADISAEPVRPDAGRTPAAAEATDTVVVGSLRWRRHTTFWSAGRRRVRSRTMITEVNAGAACCHLGIAFSAEVGTSVDDLTPLEAILRTLRVRPAR